VRRCVGAGFALLEMKVVLATLLERLRLHATDPRPEPPARRLITIGPARGASLEMEERVRVRDFGGGLRIACRQGTTDEQAVAPWMEWLRTPAPRPSEPSPDDTILDVGAHIGGFALAAASLAPDGRVLALEAGRENYEMLLRNIELNGLRNVTADRLALAEHAGQVRLRHSPAGNWGHSIADAAPDAGGETVPSMTLEGYLRDRGVERCDAAKLNCEGAEFQILLGTSPETLRAIRRMLILYHADLVEETGMVGKLEDHLESAGFELERQETSPTRGRLLADLNA
jgi:FkbM family methyltransferase